MMTITPQALAHADDVFALIKLVTNAESAASYLAEIAAKKADLDAALVAANEAHAKLAAEKADFVKQSEENARQARELDSQSVILELDAAKFKTERQDQMATLARRSTDLTTAEVQLAGREAAVAKAEKSFASRETVLAAREAAAEAKYAEAEKAISGMRALVGGK